MSSLNRLATPEGVLAPFAALVLGAVAMGVSPIFVRLADVGPFTSAFWRVALALPPLYAWMRIVEGGERAGDISRSDVLAGLAFAGDLLFWHPPSSTRASPTRRFSPRPRRSGWCVRLAFVPAEGTAGVIAGLALCLIGGAALLAQSLQLSQAGARRRLRHRDRRLLRPLFLAVQAARKGLPLRASLSRHGRHGGVLFAVAIAAEHRLPTHASLAALSEWHGSANRRPGTFGRARPSAGGLFVASDLSGGDRRSRFRLAHSCRAGAARSRRSAASPFSAGSTSPGRGDPRPSTGDGRAAVDDNGLPGHERTGLRGEINHGAGDFVGFADAPERRRRRDRLQRLRILP